jgi:hypothetical protein
MKLVIRSVGCEASPRAHEHARSTVLAQLDAILPFEAEVRVWLAWDGPTMQTPTMCTLQILLPEAPLFERAMAPDLVTAIDLAVRGARRRLADAGHARRPRVA